MANQNERVQAALAKITEATTGIASDIRELKDKIAAGEVTEETLAGLEQAAASLEAMDAENPTGTGGEVPPDGGTSTDEGAEG